MSNKSEIRGLPEVFWDKLKKTTNKKLRIKNISNVEFSNPPKNDGSYVKAKGGRKYTNWVYAVKTSEIWIEFEIKPKNKEKQQDFYDALMSNRLQIEKSLGKKLRWDNEDILISNRRQTGKDFRIKLISDYDLQSIQHDKNEIIKEWSNDMVNFIISINNNIS